MAAGPSTARAPALENGATPVHRLGEHVFDADRGSRRRRLFLGR